MMKDKRLGQKPVPDNFKELLNEVQMLTLHRLESFGWELGFVRRPLFQDPVPVVFDSTGGRFGVVEESGRVDLKPSITIRHS